MATLYIVKRASFSGNDASVDLYMARTIVSLIQPWIVWPHSTGPGIAYLEAGGAQSQPTPAPEDAVVYLSSNFGVGIMYRHLQNELRIGGLTDSARESVDSTIAEERGFDEALSIREIDVLGRARVLESADAPGFGAFGEVFLRRVIRLGRTASPGARASVAPTWTEAEKQRVARLTAVAVIHEAMHAKIDSLRLTPVIHSYAGAVLGGPSVPANWRAADPIASSQDLQQLQTLNRAVRPHLATD